MVAYNFKRRFVPRIEARSKQQTIRLVGKKRHTRAGETLTMKSGPRFKPEPVGSATCLSVDPILINLESHSVLLETPDGGARVLIGADLETFARLDGFDCWGDMRAFFLEGQPPGASWHGIRIFWGDTFVAP